VTYRQTARGVGIRAFILLLGVVLIGAWLAFKIVGAAIHLLLWIGVILVAVGVIAAVARRVRR